MQRGGRADFAERDIARLELVRVLVRRAYLNVLEWERLHPLSVDPMPVNAFELPSTALSVHLDSVSGSGSASATAFAGCARCVIARLTPREREVLRWVVEGKTDQEIAVILGTSWRTVRSQLESVFQTLNVETRTAAAMRAVEQGLIG